MRNWILGAVITLAWAGGVYMEHYNDGTLSGIHEAGLIIMIGAVWGSVALRYSINKK